MDPDSLLVGTGTAPTLEREWADKPGWTDNEGRRCLCGEALALFSEAQGEPGDQRLRPTERRLERGPMQGPTSVCRVQGR